MAPFREWGARAGVKQEVLSAKGQGRSEGPLQACPFCGVCPVIQDMGTQMKAPPTGFQGEAGGGGGGKGNTLLQVWTGNTLQLLSSTLRGCRWSQRALPVVTG